MDTTLLSTANSLIYVDFIFLLLSGLVGMSVVFMLSSKNLVYSVLNLGLLSIFLIFMWMYFLEVNFILIVYILAFIGAIVMLFLSVVLMLPSSTFSEEKSYSTLPLALLSSGGAAEKIYYFLGEVGLFLVVLNMVAVSCFYVLIRSRLSGSNFPFTLRLPSAGAFLRGLRKIDLKEKAYAFLNNFSVPSLSGVEWRVYRL